ncbi:MAG TPA: rRNA maturation RNase YbeY [Candidatus Limnocylindrales bacterium]|nr:rRNA maturation RNase YbeY [Candidatus Limnocylindrales bacterium]
MRESTVYVSPWRIDVILRDGVQPHTSIATLCRAIARALDATGAPEPSSIGLILTNDAELTELNRAHMDTDGPTDVLSFPLLAPGTFPDHPGKAAAAPTSTEAFVAPPGRGHLGDIVVSVERAAEQAAAGRGGQTGDVQWSTRDELRLLVTHGALHVCGWDHADPVEEAAMRALEQQLLAQER